MSTPKFAGMKKHTYSKDTHRVEFADDEGKPFFITIKQAGGKNRVFTSREAAIFKPHERARAQGTLDSNTALALGAQLFAETIVVGWEGIKTEDGQDFPCTPENIELFLGQFEPIFDDLYREALRVENFTGNGNADAAKNSGKPSSGV